MYKPPSDYISRPTPYNKGYEDQRVLSSSSYLAGEAGQSQSWGRRPSGKKMFMDEDECLEDESEANFMSGGYQQHSSSEEEDPLDAFMANIETEIKQQDMQCKKINESKSQNPPKKPVRDDIEDLDEMESYLKYMEDNPNAGLIGGEEDDIEIEYDEDGNPIVTMKKIIDPLPPIDHSEIEYKPFRKCFYNEHPDITKLSPIELYELRNTLDVKVLGKDPPKPCTSFAHFIDDDKLLNLIRKCEYFQPTPIQSQGLPIAMLGRDVIGIAKTGSGKTCAYILPMLKHILDQDPLVANDGPIALICAPTRELSLQIYSDAKRFCKIYNIHCVCTYGGGSKWEQSQACLEKPEVIVATPGRLIDLVKIKATNLRRVTYLVFDEADRMFDLGFEPQVRSIANHVRPDRQTMLYSATFRRKVEHLCRDILQDPITVIQGDIGAASEDVFQIVEVLPNQESKWKWLQNHLVEFTSAGSVLIFVTKKLDCTLLSENLSNKGFKVSHLHGDMDQADRNSVITNFRNRNFPIMCATDVAARGLDISSIKTVINYDVAKDIDTHTHRIGRTGRAGVKGAAYTLVTSVDAEFCGYLVRNLENANQTVSQALLDLAFKHPRFANIRARQGKGRSAGSERPGLGLGSETKSHPGLPVPPPGLVAPPCEDPQSTEPPFASHPGINTRGPMEKPVTGIDYGEPGQASNRLAAMRSAFKMQYQGKFHSASSDETNANWKPDSGTCGYGVFYLNNPPPKKHVPSSNTQSADNMKAGSHQRDIPTSDWSADSGSYKHLNQRVESNDHEHPSERKTNPDRDRGSHRSSSSHYNRDRYSSKYDHREMDREHSSKYDHREMDREHSSKYDHREMDREHSSKYDHREMDREHSDKYDHREMDREHSSKYDHREMDREHSDKYDSYRSSKHGSESRRHSSSSYGNRMDQGSDGYSCSKHPGSSSDRDRSTSSYDRNRESSFEKEETSSITRFNDRNSASGTCTISPQQTSSRKRMFTEEAPKKSLPDEGFKIPLALPPQKRKFE